MEKIQNYLSELESLFSEKDSDQEAFLDLREELLSSIEHKLSEGKTEEEIIRELGPPKEIVAMYYTGVNEDIVNRAETSVILSEDIVAEYGNLRRKKMERILKKIQTILLRILVSISLIIGMYAVLVFAYLMVSERVFLGSALLLSIGCLFFTIFLLTKKIYCAVVGGGILISFFILLYTNNFYYQGYHIKTVQELDIDQLKNVDMDILQKSSITVIPIEDNTLARVEIDGNVQDKRAFSSSNTNSTYAISSKINSLLTPFTKLDEFRIYIYLPKEKLLNKFRLNVTESDTQLFDIHATEISISAISGEISLSDSTSDSTTIQTKNAGISLKQVTSSVTIDGDNAIIVVKDGNGEINISNNNGIVKLTNVTSPLTTITTKDAKTILDGAKIDNLNLTNDTGTVILEKQIGLTTITNSSGKLVLRENEGSLVIDNGSGDIINIQETSIQGELSNKSGEIKWVQNSNHPIEFNIQEPNKQETKLQGDIFNSESSFLFRTKKNKLNLFIE